MKRILILLILSATSIFSNAQIITNGLVGYWPFNGNANDESTNSNDGTVTGATLTSDRFGISNSAYYFDGNGDYIDCGNDKSLMISTHSVNFWFKYNSDTTKIQEMINDANSLNGEFGASFKFDPTGGILSGMGGGSSDAWISANSKKSFADNDWHMFTSVYNAKTNYFALYIDGCFFTGKTNERYGFKLGKDSLIHNGSNHWIFGAHSQYFSSTNNAGPRYYNGSLDDIMFFNRPLTPKEIMKLYVGEVCISEVTIYDTIKYYDTISLAVTDTLYIKFNVGSTGGNKSLASVKVYPNPSSGLIYIDAQIPSFASGYSLTIRDNVGKSIYQSSITSTTTTVNLTNFTAKGIYYVEISDPSGGVISTKKIVIY
ncbi:MAG: T9SS type A sorting domain-containing protein [Flavobacteriales bacterium]|nr:T9SS type A sorting domain-containing protein [Flavobacteriales bacterium]